MLSQDIQKRDKLNHLLRSWPSGTVMTQASLEAQGISRQLSALYLKRRWIQKLGQGAFIKAGDGVDWMGGLYAVQQQTDLKVHLGGKSLLELKGASHFVPMAPKKFLQIYADQEHQKKPLPKWFMNGFEESVAITYLPRGLFREPIGLGLLEQSNFSIKVSSIERALMEVLALVPQVVDYTHAYLLFQNQTTLRYSLVQELLEGCTSYKVIRLFLHLAKKCDMPWLSRLDLKKIDLGQGKRQIGNGGCYDPEHKISVPKLSPFDDPNFDPEV